MVDTRGMDGLKSEGWLEYYRDGVPVRTLRIRRDTYKPVTRIIHRGTHAAQNETPSEEGV